MVKTEHGKGGMATDLASDAEQKEHEEEQCGPHWCQWHEAQCPRISHKCQSRTYTGKTIDEHVLQVLLVTAKLPLLTYLFHN